MTVLPGPPAWVTAVLAPLGAMCLVAYGASTSGLAGGAEDPVPPWVLAILTVLAGLALAWRAFTQRARLHDDRLECRNLITSFQVPWDSVEELQVVRRPGLVLVEIRIRALRRRLRIGAATRFAGDESDAVLDVLRAHPRAGALLVEYEP